MMVCHSSIFPSKVSALIKVFSRWMEDIPIIETANLGYCELFDFKCAGDRTCDAWITGGPITDESEIEVDSSEAKKKKCWYKFGLMV